MSNKLKIYACSGVDSQVAKAQFTTEDSNALQNTQAMNKLLSLINMCAADSQLVTTTPEEREKAYQDMNIYSVCFYFARLYREDSEKLREAGYAINQYLQDGKFEILSANLQDHGDRVDQIIDGVQALIDNDDYRREDSEFMRWWTDSVVAYNKCGISQEKAAEAEKKMAPRRKSQVSGSWKDNEDLNKYLNDAGSYFLYTYFTDDQLKRLPLVFRNKREKQQQVYTYCKQCFVPLYGTEADMRRIIANGIKFRFKASPEDVCSDIVNGGTEGVGQLGITEIIEIIIAVIGLLAALLPAILQYCAIVAAAKYTVPKNPDAGIATDSDFEGWSPKKSGNGLWALIIAGVAAVLLLKK